MCASASHHGLNVQVLNDDGLIIPGQLMNGFRGKVTTDVRHHVVVLANLIVCANPPIRGFCLCFSVRSLFARQFPLKVPDSRFVLCDRFWQSSAHDLITMWICRDDDVISDAYVDPDYRPRISVGLGDVFPLVHGEGHIPTTKALGDCCPNDSGRALGDLTLQCARILVGLHGPDFGQCYQMAIGVDANRPGPERARFMISALMELWEAHSSALALPTSGVVPVLDGIMGTSCRVFANIFRHFRIPRCTLTLDMIPVIAYVVERASKCERC